MTVNDETLITLGLHWPILMAYRKKETKTHWNQTKSIQIQCRGHLLTYNSQLVFPVFPWPTWPSPDSDEDVQFPLNSSAWFKTIVLWVSLTKKKRKSSAFSDFPWLYLSENPSFPFPQLPVNVFLDPYLTFPDKKKFLPDPIPGKNTDCSELNWSFTTENSFSLTP